MSPVEPAPIRKSFLRLCLASLKSGLRHWTARGLAAAFLLVLPEPLLAQFKGMYDDDTVAELFSNRGPGVIEEFQRAQVVVAEFNVKLRSARERYWNTLESDPNHAAIKEEYVKLLLEKDFGYMALSLVNATRDPGLSENANSTQPHLADLQSAIGEFDGGIHPVAAPLFRTWTQAVRHRAGARSDKDMVFVGPTFADALADSATYYSNYAAVRNVAELVQSGRKFTDVLTPSTFVEIALLLSEAQTFHSSVAGPGLDLRHESRRIRAMVEEALGKDNLLEAAKKGLAQLDATDAKTVREVFSGTMALAWIFHHLDSSDAATKEFRTFILRFPGAISMGDRINRYIDWKKEELNEKELASAIGDKGTIRIAQARGGDVRAAVEMALEKYDRSSGQRDTKLAMEMLEIAARTGPRFNVYLGAMYYFGDGVPQDKAKAISYFRAAGGPNDISASLVGDVTDGPDMEARFAELLFVIGEIDKSPNMAPIYLDKFTKPAAEYGYKPAVIKVLTVLTAPREYWREPRLEKELIEYLGYARQYLPPEEATAWRKSVLQVRSEIHTRATFPRDTLVPLNPAELEAAGVSVYPEVTDPSRLFGRYEGIYTFRHGGKVLLVLDLRPNSVPSRSGSVNVEATLSIHTAYTKAGPQGAPIMTYQMLGNHNSRDRIIRLQWQQTPGELVLKASPKYKWGVIVHLHMAIDSPNEKLRLVTMPVGPQGPATDVNSGATFLLEQKR